MTTTKNPIDVFISYKREDRETAKALAEALAHRGYSVWWDVDLLPGDTFADEIMAVIQRAKATIVLWSEQSVASRFVRAEASVADGLDRLIPARLDACELPLPFNVLHTQDLTRWRAGADETLLTPLFKALEARTGKAPTAPQPAAAAADNLHRWDREAKLWLSISTQHDAAEYAYFLKIYPDGTFADLARMRLSKLQKPRPVKATKNAIIALGGVAAASAAIISLLAPLSEYLPLADPSEPERAERQASVVERAVEPDAAAGEHGGAEHQPSVLERVVEPDTRAVVADRSYQAGNRFNDCNDENWCAEMVVVPAGSFWMGSPNGEHRRRPKEGPRQRVTIAEPFAIGVYEVTFDEWDACVADGGCDGYRPSDQDWGRGRRPVINISWNDAQSYVEWLNGRLETEGLYRVPSEAEWEYAARAGTETPFHFGLTISTDQANYNGTILFGPGKQGASRNQTVPVGSFPANAFGLHDVHGNVWEWVEDCWNDSYAEAGRPDDGTAWTTGDCGVRVLRGGSWNDLFSDLRSANRSGFRPGARFSGAGFRVARALR